VFTGEIASYAKLPNLTPSAASLLDFGMSLRQTFLLARGRMILLVMGVAGSGKTTIASELARRLNWIFLDADDFHSAANREKMRLGIHLTDEDRIPWLDAMYSELEKLNAASNNVVLACSALNEAYRQRLLGNLPAKIIFLKGSRELIQQRLQQRHGHFAGTAILDDQYATLEEPRNAIVVDVAKRPEKTVEEVLARLSENPASSNQDNSTNSSNSPA
jgi:gluconokinase